MKTKNTGPLPPMGNGNTGPLPPFDNGSTNGNGNTGPLPPFDNGGAGGNGNTGPLPEMKKEINPLHVWAHIPMKDDFDWYNALGKSEVREVAALSGKKDKFGADDLIEYKKQNPYDTTFAPQLETAYADAIRSKNNGLKVVTRHIGNAGRWTRDFFRALGMFVGL